MGFRRFEFCSANAHQATTYLTRTCHKIILEQESCTHTHTVKPKLITFPNYPSTKNKCWKLACRKMKIKADIIVNRKRCTVPPTSYEKGLRASKSDAILLTSYSKVSYD